MLWESSVLDQNEVPSFLISRLETKSTYSRRAFDSMV
jgi:hypothetical protein